MKASEVLSILAAAAATGWALANRRAAQESGDADPADAVPVEGETQSAGLWESAWAQASSYAWGFPSLWGDDSQDTAAANRRAFLDMIAFAEGTANGPEMGYATLFGGGRFDSFADHPRRLFTFRNRRGEVLKTSAAGRYQFLARTWDEVRAKLGLPDFGPDSQDAAALELIRQRGALADVEQGRTLQAIDKVRKVWASLPGAGYAQPERSPEKLLAAYWAAGGQTNEA